MRKTRNTHGRTAVIVAAASGWLWLVSLSHAAQPTLALYDTGTGAAEAWPAEALTAKTGWAEIGEGSKPAAFQGDAVLLNARVAAVVRKKGTGVELYGSADGNGWKLRAHLRPAGAQPGALKSAKTVERDETAVTLELVYADAKGGTAGLAVLLPIADPILETRPLSGVTALRVSAPARLAVMPDFFADDMLLDARSITVDATEAPGDNILVHLLDAGNAMVAAVWDRGGDDMRLFLSGAGEKRQFESVELEYGKDGRVWVAVLEGKGLWAQTEITEDNVKKTIELDWETPFRAKWKGSFMRTDLTADSWEFKWNPGQRRCWSGVVGNYEWPCWIEDTKGVKARIQPPIKFPNGNFSGPFVVYPIERDSETPLDRMTVTDIMQNSLGVGPCQHIMDVAGQGVNQSGIYTCAFSAQVPPVYRLGHQKDERAFIRVMLREVQIFVKVIQDRINDYVAFREEMLQYLTQQKAARPEWADFIGRLEKQTERIEQRKAGGAARIASWAQALEADILSDTPKTDAAKIAAQIEGVGLGQDNTVARCRHAVRVLRQMAAIEMAVNPGVAELASEIRDRTQKMLRGAYSHEMR